MDEISEPTVKYEDRDWEVLLFDWILQLEFVAQAIALSGGEEYLFNALLALHTSMKERLRALGGEYAERLEGD
ncbi:MAG: hypothetical protein IIA89_15650 [Chloroflexi bacterium]|nr:hypothetical protein [Chloroflexota bacterium]